MKDNMKTKQQIENALILATANLLNTRDVLGSSEEVNEIVRQFLEEWEDAECDEEGATPEQNEVLDAILDKYTQKIYETINAK